MAKFFYALEHEQFQPETLVRHAKLAEEAGFDGLIVSEHFHPWVDDKGAAGFAFSTLGAIAEATGNIELMTGVTTPLFRYHPAVVAQAAATIDRLSGGRFMLGVGTGENINEGSLGYDFPKYGERAERMREALHIIQALLNGEKLDFDGKYYKTVRAKLYSPPVHRVPILLAAGGPKSATLAGESAAGVITSVRDPQKTMAEIVKPAREAAKRTNRPEPLVAATRWTMFGKSEDDLWEAVKPWRGLRTPNRLSAVDPKELRKDADAMPREEILNKFAAASSPQDYINAYEPLVRDIGADIVVIYTSSTNQEETIRTLGSDVLPELRR